MEHQNKQREDVSNDIYDDIPLHKKQAFSAGLHRRKINFVPSSDAVLNTTPDAGASACTPAPSTSDFYLNLVLSKHDEKTKTNSSSDKMEDLISNPATEHQCEVCKLPIPGPGHSKAWSKAHETSIAHQFCISHSHPPSALDRSRMGLSVLESQGWDPDARKGLGTEGQGIRDPIKAAVKSNNLGIGMKVPKDLLGPNGTNGLNPNKVAATPLAKVGKKNKLLDAKQARKKAGEDRKKHDTLVQQFYGNPDVERYLGGG